MPIIGNVMNIVIGVIMIILGGWLSYFQLKRFAEGVADTLGGNAGLLIIGIALVVIGIMMLFK
jgi:hypothetical protein